MEEPVLKICLLSYRGNPYSGGQGVYIYYLSRELRNLGHEVHVVSGPPYPELVDGITLHKMESLMLYDRKHSFAEILPKINSPLKFYELVAGLLGSFSEPLTFSIRAYGSLKSRLMDEKFDIIHDNQCLGYGLLLMKNLNIPVLATIHHPVHIDRKIEISQTKNLWKKFLLTRWFSFIGMQNRVSRRLERIITVSYKSAEDIHRFYGVSQDALRVVYNGIDIDYFKTNGNVVKEPQSLIMVSSGSGYFKGVPNLLDALRLLKNEVKLKVTIIGANDTQNKVVKMVKERGLEDIVSFTGKIEKDELVRRYCAAEFAVVPSVYEGFGFPAAEAMACKLPVIATRAGALPEVVGEDGEAGILVPLGDPAALANAIKRLLADEPLRKKMGEAGRKRMERNFSWNQAARKTVEVYQELVGC
ncbi:MAG TPA: glycosyltransferase family 4 protein [Dehalococcoidales bacterium]